MASRGRPKKFTFKRLYKEFCDSHPKLKEHVLWWHPYGYMTILLYLDEGIKILYDGETFRPKFFKK